MFTKVNYLGLWLYSGLLIAERLESTDACGFKLEGCTLNELLWSSRPLSQCRIANQDLSAHNLQPGWSLISILFLLDVHDHRFFPTKLHEIKAKLCLGSYIHPISTCYIGIISIVWVVNLSIRRLVSIGPIPHRGIYPFASCIFRAVALNSTASLSNPSWHETSSHHSKLVVKTL